MNLTHSKNALQFQLDEINSLIHANYEDAAWDDNDHPFPGMGDLEHHYKKLVVDAQAKLDAYVSERANCYATRQSMADEMTDLLRAEIELGAGIKEGKDSEKGARL